MLTFSYTAFSQDVDVDVNLNIVHSVEGVSDFGRERHMIVHATPTDADWEGEEDKLEYLINDLDVYFGRDNGSATWKFNNTPQDENRPNKPDLTWMEGEAERLKSLYDQQYLAHQFEYKGPMIMGTNPHPTYPTLNWQGPGTTWTGWQPQTIETSVEWVVQYLDKYFKDNPGGSGEPMPTYWEVVNEIDMLMMTGHQTWTTLEHVWEYHNLVAQGVKERLGDRAPKVGGMTWGMHDFHMLDWTSRYSAQEAMGWGVPEEAVASKFEQYQGDDWYQWDVLWQGYIDYCGEETDFYGVHIYDWPTWETPSSVIRSGGHTEAMLDILEWYDLYKKGEKTEIVLSEYGAVSGHYIDNMPDADPKRRDWENLKPFNSMLMQFLERPAHITLTMPFTPIKAHWGDHLNADGSIKSRYPYKMLDDDGTGEYVWTEFIKFFELWSDVKGTRVDTKSTNIDIQVDAYVEGNKTYLILNNLNPTESGINLNFFDDNENAVQSVKIKHLYLDENRGAAGEPVLSEKTVATAPGKVVLGGDATMVLEYTFASDVTLNASSKEYKFMGEKLGTGSTVAGGDKIHTSVSNGTLTANVNNITIPEGASEAMLRISGDFYSDHIGTPVITVNGYDVNYDGNVRGITDIGRNKWLGVLEVEVPVAYLQANNVITCSANNQIEYATVQMQIWDFSKTPGRSENNNGVALSGVSLDAPSSTLMQGKTISIGASFTPANATSKVLTWSSSAPAVATVDEYGVVTAVASSGSATISATDASGSISSSVAISAIPYSETRLSGVAIVEGSSIDVDHYVTTPLTVSVIPEDATNQTVVWSSSNDEVVTVDAVTGKINGISIGESAIITATITDNGQAFTASTTVNVGIVGNEEVYCNTLPSEVTGNTTYSFDVFVNLLGTRELTVELMQGNTVLGTGSTVADVSGKDVVAVEVNLSSVPAIGNYSLRTTAKSGGQVIDQCISNISILEQIRPASVTISEWLREVEIGQTLPVTAIVAPENAYNKDINWTSSNTSVASVNNSGIVTGVSLGTTVIRATTQDGGLFAEVTVQVKSQVIVQPTQIFIPSEVTIFPNGTLQVEAIFTPEWTTEKNINWASSNTALATVNANGLVSASGTTGTFTLTATSASANNVSVTSAATVGTTLTVQAENFSSMGGAVGEIAIYDIPSGGQGINNVQAGDFVEYEVYIPEAGEYEISFLAGTGLEDGVIEMYVEGTSVGAKQVPMNDWDAFATVQLDQNVILPQGLVKIGLVAAGSSAWNWNLDYFQMAFKGEITCDPLTGVSITATSTTIQQGNEATLTAVLQPSSACATNVTWTSSNTNIASVDQSGKVTGIGVGTVTITATTQDGNHTATQDIVVEGMVNIGVTGVAISALPSTMDIGNTRQLTASVSPANATNKTVTWASSNTSVATVNASGLVTALTEGTVTITVTTTDGNFTANTSTTVEETIIVLPPDGDDIVIEAEDLIATGGTFNDGQVPLGVNVANQGINWVNLDDWAEYSIVGNGTYTIEYLISSPMDGAAIEFELDDVVISTVNVPNNGQWDDYQVLETTDEVVLSGEHTLKIYGRGSNTWQWNLDKITLRAQATTTPDVDVIGVTVSSSSENLEVSETVQVNATVLPANATNTAVNWASNNTAVATVVNGVITAVAEGTAIITVTTLDGGFTASTNVTITDPSNGGGFASLVIEAEDFVTHGGSYNDGFVPLGVNKVNGLGINWVNSGDWTEYTINVEVTGTYGIEYMISTPENNAQIQVAIDGETITTDNVPNNGQWDVYSALQAGNDVVLSAGIHTVRCTASGTGVWQWNLDKMTLTTGSSSARITSNAISLEKEIVLGVYPNPSSNVLNLNGLKNGTYNVSIFSMNGVNVFQGEMDYRYTHQLDINQLPSGIYLLRVNGEGVDKRVRISVKK
ncbi:Ig-like domain-containing protein [Flammeovirga kamogawensis]|uniref:Ig-like domain-containing protein n=1 Tax=Flammeovirga kamogawensis TaxID=373891 RepID=A0ABX8H2P5_9BACT|nr:Ig-like domain-containing protein [Flammeovirga kamogawensis]QWG10183.1 Ig-like domain-containing protein [Flammeovirga kamogawensis]